MNFEYSSTIYLVFGVLGWLLSGLLIASSKVWHSVRFAAPLVVGAIVVGLGMLFKVERWAGGREILLVGAFLVLIIYSLWFKQKTRTLLLDYLKLAWVVSAWGAMLALALYSPLIRPLAGIAQGFFWAVALLYVYQRWIRRPQQLPE